MTRKQHALLLVLCGFAYVFLGTVPGFSIRMNYTSWFCVLFLIASFIRLYPIKLYSNNTFWGIATLAAVAVSAMSVVCCVWLGEKIGRTGLAYLFVQDSNTLLAVLTGICSFMFFKNLKIPQNKVINTMAASTFGVLCIHANSDTMRNWLWKDTVRPVEAYGSLWMPLHAVGCSLAIFMVCIGIDILRIQLIEKYGMKLWDILEKKWNKNKMLGKDK